MIVVVSDDGPVISGHHDGAVTLSDYGDRPLTAPFDTTAIIILGSVWLRLLLLRLVARKHKRGRLANRSLRWQGRRWRWRNSRGVVFFIFVIVIVVCKNNEVSCMEFIMQWIIVQYVIVEH